VQTDSNASYLPEIERALVVRDTVLTVSTAGVKSNSLSSLANLGWAAFPALSVPKVGVGGPSGPPTNPKPYAPAAVSAARTRPAVIGTCRIRTPVASKNALAIAAGVPGTSGSPAPVGTWSVRWNTATVADG
jgi:hypothetical protein